MGWNNIVIEGHCMYKYENGDNSFLNVPCSNKNPGFICADCICSDANDERCKYFGFLKARSCVVLTDHDGNEIDFESYYSDEHDEELWFKGEKEWSNKWQQIFKNMRSL